MSPRPASERGGGSRVSSVGAVGWAVTGVAALTLLAGCSGPGAVDVAASSPPPDPAVRAMCHALLDDLPDTVADDLSSRDVSPPDARAAAWGDPAVVLRCGVRRPDALTRTSACFEVN